MSCHCRWALLLAGIESRYLVFCKQCNREFLDFEVIWRKLQSSAWRRTPLLSNIGLSKRILHFESILEPRFSFWILEKKKFYCDILISRFLARMTSSVTYCWSLGFCFLIRKTKLKTVAKIRSNLFQFVNRVESITCSDKLREDSCVANRFFEEFSGTLSCLVEKNAGAVSHLAGLSFGLRPRFPWSAGFSFVETCFHR